GGLERPGQPFLFVLLLLQLLAGIVDHLRVALRLQQLAGVGDGLLRPSVSLVQVNQGAQLGLLLAQALDLLQVLENTRIGEPVVDGVVARPDRLQLFEHQAAASVSSCRAPLKAARATAIWPSSGSRVVSFWVVSSGSTRTLTIGFRRWRPRKRMHS